MMQSTTIKLFLIDGKPANIRAAEISSWTGKAIAQVSGSGLVLCV